MNTFTAWGFGLLILLSTCTDLYAQNIHQPDAERFFKQGIIFHDQLALDQATAYYTEALQLNASHSRALFNRGLVFYEQGKLDLAYRDIDQLVQIHPEDMEARELRSQIQALLHESYGTAAPHELIPQGSQSNRPQYALADAAGFSEKGLGHSQQNRQEEIIRQFEAAISLNTLDNSVYYNQASAQWTVNEYPTLSATAQPDATEPTNSESLLNRAFYWMEMGDFNKALSDGTQASEMDYQNARAFYCIGLLKMHFKNYAAALSHFERATQIDPHNAKLFYYKGIAQYYLKQYVKAGQSIAHSIQMGRISSEAYSMMGEAKYMAGFYESALMDQKTAVELDTNNRDAFERMNKCYYSLSHAKFAQTLPMANYLNQEKGEQEEYFGDEFEGNPAPAATPQVYEYILDPGKNELLSKALFFNRAGRYEEAIPEFDQVIHLDSDHFRAYNGRGFAHFHLKNYEKALQDFSVAIDINPDFAEANYNRGNVYFATGQIRKALKDYDRALAVDQSYAKAYYMRAQCHTRFNNISAALNDYDHCLDISTVNVNALNNRGSLRLMSGNVFGALEDYNEAIVIEPEKAVLYANRARLKAHIMNYEGAIADYNIAIDVQEPDEELRFHRGLALLKNEDYESAIIDFTEAIKISDDEMYDYYYHRALTFHSLDQFPKAVADYNRTIELNPSHRDAFFNRAKSKTALADEKGAAADYARAEQLGAEQTLSLKKQ